MTVNCKDMQEEEWEVLQSIYPDFVSRDNSSLRIDIPIDLGSSRNISFGSVDLRLSTFPPILLNINLPESYPLLVPPRIDSLHVTHSWLPSAHRLPGLLLKMWQQGEGILCTWIEWIHTAQFLKPLGLIGLDNVICIPDPLIAPLLLAHENTTSSAQFSHTSFTCSICLTSLKGARCLQLACMHVFCRACLQDFWSLCIAEGDIHRVGCPDPVCVKAGCEAEAEDVRRVVTDEEVKRWNWLRGKRAFEQDPSLVHCPLEFCQAPVPKPQVDEDEESGWARLRICPSCRYSFCSFCKRTWHGPLSDCPISVTETLVLEYIELPEGSPQRQVLERQFGRSNIARLVARYEEEQANKKYFETSTMACPGCHVHVQKSLGCNHMTCAKCGMHFCYCCGEKLNAANPYAHFSTPGHGCYYKLFDFQTVQDEWQPLEGLIDGM